MDIRTIVVDNTVELKEKLTKLLNEIPGVTVCQSFDDAVAAMQYVEEHPEELSVHDNLLLWYRGDRKRLEKDLTDGPAAILGITEMLRKTAGQLSGGMKKRLNIACALAFGSQYLIMDEPGAALDLECKEAVRQYLKAFREHGGALLLASHEMEELALCTKMYRLAYGNLKEIPTGLTAEELIREFQ